MGLAAAKETLKKIRHENVINRIFTAGNGLKNCFSDALLSGHPSWTFVNFQAMRHPENESKSLVMQELAKRGILSLGQHVINGCHSNSDMEKLIIAYREIFDNFGSIELECEPLKGEFRIR